MRTKRQTITEIFKDTLADIIFITETWIHPDTSLRTWTELIFSAPAPANVDNKRAGHHPHGVAVLSRHSPSHFQLVQTVPGKLIVFGHNLTLFAGVYWPPESPRWSEDDCLGQFRLIQSLYEAGAWTDLIIFGDMNMKLGLAGDSDFVREGLAAHFLSYGLNRLASSNNVPTFFSRGRNGKVSKSTPDHFFASRGLVGIFTGLLVITDLDTGSDHRPLLASFSCAPIEVEKGHSRWKTRRLEEENTLQRFREQLFEPLSDLGRRCHLTAKIRPPLCPQEIVDELYLIFVTTISTVCDTVLGKSEVCRAKRKLPLNQDFIQATRHRNEAFKIMRTMERSLGLDIGLLISGDSRVAYDQVVRTYRFRVQYFRKAKKLYGDQSWDQLCFEMEYKPGHEQMKRMRFMRNGLTRQKALLKNRAEDMAKYRNHFSKQFTRHDWQLEGEYFDEIGEESFDVAHLLKITTAGVLLTIKGTPRGKAPGESMINSEILQGGGEVVAECLAGLFQLFISWQVVPSRWRVATLCPVPKKGDLSRIENYRPISLLEVPRKIFECTLLETFVLDIVEPLNISQGGFRKGRSTVDQVASLQEALLQASRRLDRAPVLAFLDIKAAYDSVDRLILWKKMKDKGMAPWLVSLLKALYDNCASQVTVGGRRSDSVPHTMGIMQGSVLSPLLYCCFLDDIADCFLELKTGPLGNLFLYADDIALVADDAAHLQTMLNELEGFSVRNNFRFAPAKCEVVAPDGVCGPFRLYEQEMPISPFFNYLGVTMEIGGMAERIHISRLMQKARVALGELQQLGMNETGFSDSMKRSLYICFVRTNLEYAIQLLKPTKANIGLLQSVQNDSLRVMCALPSSTSIAALHAHFALPTMATRWEQLHAKWMLRVQQGDDSKMVHKAYTVALEGTGNKSMLQRPNPTFDRFLAIRQNLPGINVWKAMDLAVDEALEKSVSSSWGEAESRQLEGVEAFVDVDTAKARLRSFSRAPVTPDGRKLSRRWILRRAGYGYIETKCARCHLHHPTVYHIQLCIGLDIDALCRSRQWKQVARQVTKAIRMCCPWAYYPSLNQTVPRAPILQTVPKAPKLAKRRGDPIDRGRLKSGRRF